MQSDKPAQKDIIKIFSIGILLIIICDIILAFTIGNLYRSFYYGIVFKDAFISLVVGIWVGNRIKTPSVYNAIVFTLNYIFFYEILVGLGMSFILGRPLSLNYDAIVRVLFRFVSPFVGVIIGGVLAKRISETKLS